ncbi:Uma2 family endonuclease [Thermovenabulum sp.]|uniref:Uma2 family endonuclease n=1 Tax=Thermovenabulum sp. TaxID=3100335 RepID=UPI003C7EA0E7
MPLPKEDRIYTYADYIKWPENQRIELIDGKVYLMTSPSRIHQKTLGKIFYQFANYLKDKSCEVYMAPFDVRFPDKNEENEKDIKNVVQPDMIVVCDEAKLDEKGCKGAPDLVVEIVSPSTAQKDKLHKFNLYEKHGVKEYWIVEPENKILNVFTLQENKRYGRPDIYSQDDKVKVSIFEDLMIDLKDIF